MDLLLEEMEVPEDCSDLVANAFEVDIKIRPFDAHYVHYTSFQNDGKKGCGI